MDRNSITVIRLLNIRLRSGVLQLSLGIALIVSIICSSVILLIYYHKIYGLQRIEEERLFENAESGIQYSLAKRMSLPYTKKVNLDLFGQGSDSVQIVRVPWGLFEIMVSKAWKGKQSIERSAMMTALPDTLGQSVIYLCNRSPLYVVGKTRIIGDAYLSERKLVPGFIDGRDYESSRLLYGEARVSKSTLPSIDTSLVQVVQSIISEGVDSKFVMPLYSLPFNTSSTFTSGLLNYYHSDQSIDLEDTLSGNFIIHSEIKVRVTSSAVLSDILILAPRIDIDSDFHGSIQCFATKVITVDPAAKLSYPSALVLLGAEQDSLIQIRSNAVVEGQAIIVGYKELSSKGVFKIESGAVFHGMAYINGSTNVKGTIFGHLTTQSIQSSIGDAVYENHLLDATIDGKGRSPYMPGSLSWANNGKLVIAKQMY